MQEVGFHDELYERVWQCAAVALRGKKSKIEEVLCGMCSELSKIFPEKSISKRMLFS
jgi:hypothetical protein